MSRRIGEDGKYVKRKTRGGHIDGSTEDILIPSDSSSSCETKRKGTERIGHSDVVEVTDESERSDTEAIGIGDIKFGRRFQPRRCSRATR